MSYIKREDALDAVLFALAGTGYQSNAIYAIKDVPTADVVEVRHGEWKQGDMPIYGGHKCSVCGENTLHYQATFCPNCGAKMDKREERDRHVKRICLLGEEK